MFGIQFRQRQHAQSDLAPVDLGPVAGNESVFFQRANPAPARRGAQADAQRKICIGQAPIGLQLVQDGAVVFVEYFHLTDY